MSALSRLTPRERLLVLVVLPLLVVFAAYRFAWIPVQDARDSALAEIAAYRLISASAAVAADRPAPLVAPADPDRAPIATRVTRRADTAGLSLRRLEPEGERLRVTLEADFAMLMLWIADLEAEDSVIVSAIELDRRVEPGTVSARLTLEDG